MVNQQLDLHKWLDVDFSCVQDLDDKYQEFLFFLNLLSKYSDEKNISKYRWVLSTVLNAAYSYFESSAYQAEHFHYYCDENGEEHISPDEDAKNALEKHVRANYKQRNKRITTYPKNSTEEIELLYGKRNDSVHRGQLFIQLNNNRFIFADGVYVDDFLRTIESNIKTHHDEIHQLR